MITVATTVPEVLERSAMRGHPPMETSPRPSATGSLHAAVGVVETDTVVVVVEGAVDAPEPEPEPELVLTHCSLPPVRLQTSVTVLVFCVCPALAHFPPTEAAFVMVAPPIVTTMHVAATATAANARLNLFGRVVMMSNLVTEHVPAGADARYSSSVRPPGPSVPEFRYASSLVRVSSMSRLRIVSWPMRSSGPNAASSTRSILRRSGA